MTVTKIKRKPQKAPPKEPDEVVTLEQRDFFGPPPLIPGEDPIAYETLLARVKKMIHPKDVFEEIWVQDLVELTWDTFRLRRLRSNVFKTYAHNRVAEIFEKPTGGDELLQGWALGGPNALAEVNRRLAAEGLTMDGLMADGLVANLDVLAPVDRMIAGSEARRNQILRELERHNNSIYIWDLRGQTGGQSDDIIGVDYDKE
jgi:hypothetical protein